MKNHVLAENYLKSFGLKDGVITMKYLAGKTAETSQIKASDHGYAGFSDRKRNPDSAEKPGEIGKPESGIENIILFGWSAILCFTLGEPPETLKPI